MLAVRLWCHAASPAKLAIEIGKIAIAAFICDLGDVLVGISKKLARIADTKFDQDFHEGTSSFVTEKATEGRRTHSRGFGDFTHRAGVAKMLIEVMINPD